MKRRKLFGFLLIPIAGAVAYFTFGSNSSTAVEFQTSAVTRGIIQETISSTGTLDAVGTVEVGTQISGTVAKVLVDYNSVVRKGQTIAVLDVSALQASLDESNAALLKARTQFELSRSNWQRNQKLQASGHIAEQDLLDSRATYVMDSAAVMSAEATLRKTLNNLSNATIRSPISGTVIARSIEVGQTVAASLSTPTLFVIAEDLAHMEILASVDESDIGSIRVGQAATFSVQAYADSTFTGTVSQIRLQPTTTSNVVNYTVVIKANNPNRLLLPGMTANLEFIVAESDSAFLVPNSALTFRPSMEQRPKPQNPPPRMRNSPPPEKTDSTLGMVWSLDAHGTLHPHRVKIGMTNGTHSALLEAENLESGTPVVTGTKATSKEKKTEQRSLLSPARGAGGPPPPH